MTSISPLSGQPPYSLSVDSIHIAGQSPLPPGSFALTSSFPYFQSPFPFVISLAEVYLLSPSPEFLAIIYKDPFSTLALLVSAAVYSCNSLFPQPDRPI